MKILPPRTRPPSRKIDRVHAPVPAVGRLGYREYRACLRWEFGFTCAFCLLHESDLAEFGAEGLGLTGVEHFVPVAAQGEVNSYDNCFYAGRLCNVSRAKSPVIDRHGRRLLHPCGQVWADHFESTPDDNLLPIEGDADAAYTHGVYDLDDPGKVEIRQARRERLEESLQVLRDGPELLEMMMERLREGPPEKSSDLTRVAERIRRSIEHAVRVIHRYAAIPRDADNVCRCGRTDHHRLPVGLDDQAIDMPLSV